MQIVSSKLEVNKLNKKTWQTRYTYVNHKSMLNHIAFLFSRSIRQLCKKLAVGWEWMNEIFMLSHMAFLYQFNSHHNEPNYYYRNSFVFFCSEFAAYIRRNRVSYGFYDKIFCLMRLLIEDGLHSGATDLYSMNSKINYCYWLIAVIFIEIIFSVTLYVVWYVIILFTWTTVGPCHLFHPLPPGTPCWELFSVIISKEQVLTDSQCNG